jgi:hypothetical protein
MPTLGISEDDAPFSEPLANQAVLGLQVFDHRRLLPVQPTGDQHEQELKQSRGSRHPGPDVGGTTLPRQPSRPNCYPASRVEFSNSTGSPPKRAAPCEPIAAAILAPAELPHTE